MREIIFRGKRIDNGEWVEGFFSNETCDSVFSPMYEQANIIKKGTGYWYSVIPNTIGQYTGLTDKNGKRIFEGDIVKDHTIGMFGDVVFSIVDVPSFGINDVCDGLQYHDGFWHDLEVIGNIHDNPELLKR